MLHPWEWPSPHIHLRGYARRTPEQTVLYEALLRHAETFLGDVSADPASSGLPAFVRGEVERFTKCGILAHGFVRVYCPSCKDDLLVGFSCKGRGLCPSCGARRMADTARRCLDALRLASLSMPNGPALAFAANAMLRSLLLLMYQSHRVAERHPRRRTRAASGEPRRPAVRRPSPCP